MGKRKWLAVKSSKWKKWKMINKAGDLACCQPNTSPYSGEELKRYLDKYRTIFVKPDKGKGGENVIRITYGDELVALTQRREYRFSSFHQLKKWLKQVRNGKKFLVQQGIALLPLDGKPVDIRTVVQRHKDGKWIVTGIFAKVAKKGKAVTNLTSGGKLMHVTRYLDGVGMNQSEGQANVHKMFRFSSRVAKELNKSFTNKIYHLDIALDKKKKLWLIEVNTDSGFGKLKRIDKQMYKRTIQLYDYNRKK